MTTTAPCEGEADPFLSWLEHEIDEASMDVGAAHQEGGVATDVEKERVSIFAFVRERYLALSPAPTAPVGVGADRLMQEFYLSAAYDPKAERPADVVKAAIGFALSASPQPGEGGSGEPCGGCGGCDPSKRCIVTEAVEKIAQAAQPKQESGT